MKILVAIPAYNEETGIGSVVLRSKKYADKVIVVDDGSTDKTAETAELAGAEVIRHHKNSGYGSSIKSCFECARKHSPSVLVILDGDGQHNPDCMPKLVNPILSGEADIVIGSRFLETKSEIPAYRKAGMKVLDTLTNIGTGKAKNVSDSQSGYRTYSPGAYTALNLNETGMGTGSEILIQADERKLKIKEVPIKVRYDTGKSSEHPVTHGIHVVMAIIRVISQRRPLFFFGISGTVMLVLGLGVGWHVMDVYNHTQELATGNALIAVTLTITGMFTMLTGVILYSLEDTVRRIIGKHREIS